MNYYYFCLIMIMVISIKSCNTDNSLETARDVKIKKEFINKFENLIKNQNNVKNKDNYNFQEKLFLFPAEKKINMNTDDAKYETNDQSQLKTFENADNEVESNKLNHKNHQILKNKLSKHHGKGKNKLSKSNSNEILNKSHQLLLNKNKKHRSIKEVVKRESNHIRNKHSNSDVPEIDDFESNNAEQISSLISPNYSITDGNSKKLENIQVRCVKSGPKEIICKHNGFTYKLSLPEQYVNQNIIENLVGSLYNNIEAQNRPSLNKNLNNKPNEISIGVLEKSNRSNINNNNLNPSAPLERSDQILRINIPIDIDSIISNYSSHITDRNNPEENESKDFIKLQKTSNNFNIINPDKYYGSWINKRSNINSNIYPVLLLFKKIPKKNFDKRSIRLKKSKLPKGYEKYWNNKGHPQSYCKRVKTTTTKESINNGKTGKCCSPDLNQTTLEICPCAYQSTDYPHPTFCPTTTQRETEIPSRCPHKNISSSSPSCTNMEFEKTEDITSEYTTTFSGEIDNLHYSATTTSTDKYNMSKYTTSKFASTVTPDRNVIKQSGQYNKLVTGGKQKKKLHLKMKRRHLKRKIQDRRYDQKILQQSKTKDNEGSIDFQKCSVCPCNCGCICSNSNLENKEKQKINKNIPHK